MKSKGSVTDFLPKHKCGHILTEDGTSLYFDKSSLEGTDASAISAGVCVEYEELDRADGVRVTWIKPIPGLSVHRD